MTFTQPGTNLETVDYRRITVAPIAGALGAVIGGVDLAELDDETVAEIRAAWLQHLVVLAPGEQHAAWWRLERVAR